MLSATATRGGSIGRGSHPSGARGSEARVQLLVVVQASIEVERDESDRQQRRRYRRSERHRDRDGHVRRWLHRRDRSVPLLVYCRLRRRDVLTLDDGCGAVLLQLPDLKCVPFVGVGQRCQRAQLFLDGSFEWASGDPLGIAQQACQQCLEIVPRGGGRNTAGKRDQLFLLFLQAEDFVIEIADLRCDRGVLVGEDELDHLFSDDARDAVGVARAIGPNRDLDDRLCVLDDADLEAWKTTTQSVVDGWIAENEGSFPSGDLYSRMIELVEG